MILSGEIWSKVVPYTRGALSKKGKGKKIIKVKTAQGRRYEASQEVLAKHLFTTWINWHHPDPKGAHNRLLLAERASKASPYKYLLKAGQHLITEPYRFGLAIGAPVVKSGERKGLLPIREGDYDNFVKAFLDAAQQCSLIPDDSLHWYRGPCDVKGGIRSGVYVAPEWAFLWCFELEEQCFTLPFSRGLG